MALQSAIINVMEKAVKKASIRLVRDFNEVEHLQVSRKGPADFVSRADVRTERTIVEELIAYVISVLFFYAQRLEVPSLNIQLISAKQLLKRGLFVLLFFKNVFWIIAFDQRNASV